jgi:hypothetical protein
MRVRVVPAFVQGAASRKLGSLEVSSVGMGCQEMTWAFYATRPNREGMIVIRWWSRRSSAGSSALKPAGVAAAPGSVSSRMKVPWQVVGNRSGAVE